jgi:hypothetical protein
VLLQLASLVAQGGHVFMIVVPENDPQGEWHTLAAECMCHGSSSACLLLLLLAAS